MLLFCNMAKANTKIVKKKLKQDAEKGNDFIKLGQRMRELRIKKDITVLNLLPMIMIFQGYFMEITKKEKGI